MLLCACALLVLRLSRACVVFVFSLVCTCGVFVRCFVVWPCCLCVCLCLCLRESCLGGVILVRFALCLCLPCL